MIKKYIVSPFTGPKGRGFGNQDFGTGKPHPGDYPIGGGVDMPAPVRFRFGMEGAGCGNYAEVAKKKK